MTEKKTAKTEEVVKEEVKSASEDKVVEKRVGPNFIRATRTT